MKVKIPKLQLVCSTVTLTVSLYGKAIEKPEVNLYIVQFPQAPVTVGFKIDHLHSLVHGSWTYG